MYPKNALNLKQWPNPRKHSLNLATDFLELLKPQENKKKNKK